jgi:hypothetical protein
VFEQAVFIEEFDCNKNNQKHKPRGGRVTMRNILVTEKNVSQIPVEWLCVRHSKLKKKLKFIDTDNLTNPELIKEIKLIEEYLAETGKSNLVEGIALTEVQQLELDIPVALQEQYVPIVEYRLREYYSFLQRKKRITSELSYLKVQVGMTTPQYGNLSGVAVGGNYSSTEAAVIKHFDRIERYKNELEEIEEAIYPMQRALQQLTGDQLKLVEAKYFVKEKPKNDNLIQELSWGRQKFFDLKKAALILIAESLRIV